MFTCGCLFIFHSNTVSDKKKDVILYSDSKMILRGNPALIKPAALGSACKPSAPQEGREAEAGGSSEALRPASLL